MTTKKEDSTHDKQSVFEERSKHLETMAIASHGSMATLHAIGAYHHINQKRFFHAAFHTVATCFSIGSVIVHHVYRGKQHGD